MPARTHHFANSGRMGTMDLPFEGGCFAHRGPGLIVQYQWLTAKKGRMGTIGRRNVDLGLGKDFGRGLKTFPVCGRKSSSLSSPSSLFGLQVIVIKRNLKSAMPEIILPEFRAILPILPEIQASNQQIAAIGKTATRY